MNTNEKETINANDFIGNYLVKEDIDNDLLVTLVDVRAETVRDAPRRKLLASFEEFAKPLLLTATNIKRLCKMFGSTNAQDWRGQVLLYVDENVEYGGKITGGIRLRSAGEDAAVATQVEPVAHPAALAEASVF